MGLAFIPLYINYLGIEAYGLIGLFVMLQAWLSLLDMGMTPSLGREMARLLGGSHTPESIRDLLRSIEIVALSMAIIIVGGMTISANWLAVSWVQADSLPIEGVTQAFVIMGFVAAVRFLEGIYRGSIVGLQRQVLFNVVNSTMATLRGLGSVGVLAWIENSIEAFFIWQGLISIATLLILVLITYGILPHAERAGQFSLVALLSVWKFAGGMVGITFLALLLTQIDKILLSKMLTLSEYGYYALAAIVAGALFMVITPITQALYPRFCELYARNEHMALADTYHKGAQLVSLCAGSVAIVTILFAESLLRLWTQDPELAHRTATLLSLLMLGNLLNGIMHIPYMMQLAHGLTSIAVRVNIVAVAVVVPAIAVVTPRFGAEGAAWVWVCLNAGYVVIGIHLMYRRILETEKWRWYTQDVFKPLLFGSAAAAAVSLIWNVESSNVADAIQLTLAAVITFTVMLLATGIPRQYLQRAIKARIKKSNDDAQTD